MHEPDCRFDSAEEATRTAIAASGMTLKQVGSAIWPDRSPTAAHTALANALNDNRQERLTSDQHVLVANLTGQYHWLAYAACRCGFEAPKRKEKSVELRELRDLLRQQQATGDAIEARLKAMEERMR